MKLRSLLFVPGDRPDRMEKALGAGADALILDLEDSVAPQAKPEARRAVAQFLGVPSQAQLWVRVNPLDSPESDKDLAAILAGHPDAPPRCTPRHTRRPFRVSNKRLSQRENCSTP